MPRFQAFSSLLAFVAASCASSARAQTYTPLQEIPGGELMGRMQSALAGIGAGGEVAGERWDLVAGELWFERDGWKTLELATGAVKPAQGEPPASAQASRAERRGGDRRPARGRQFTRAESPDGKWVAVSDGGNVFLEPVSPEAQPAPAGRIAITSDGNDDVKYGQASWVYGEELDQDTAMWWSPDSRFLAFYRFDESKVKDFYILDGWSGENTRVLSEAYPKPGAANPTAAILVYELDTRTRAEVDAFSEASGAIPGAEQYLYNARWTPDGTELLVSRTPRRQDVLEVLAANPRSGATRVVVREEQETWQENRPEMRFLKDGRRFVWATERTGFQHFELRSLDGGAPIALTTGEWPAESIELVDEAAGELWFTAWSGAVPVQQQLHVAKLDGSGSVRVTGDDLHHTNFRISPDGSFVLATAETTATPPHARVYSSEGRLLAALGEGGVQGIATHGLRPTELFTCKAADGATDLYGKISFPPAFDPARKYPVVVNTYGGPTAKLVTDRFEAGDPRAALGFLLVTVDNRGTPGRGKAFQSGAYMKLGQVDLDDQAAAVQHLAASRPYVDGARVGITGHSYGGYMAALAVIRRGDVFHAAVAGAPPTDWRQYDTIYTERYMRTPQENAEGYDAGSCVKNAGNLKGRLLLLHGMMDDNVHPNNTFQLAHALQSLNRPFSMMLFPNAGHGIRSPSVESVKWSFLVEALAPTPSEWGPRADATGEAVEGGKNGTKADAKVDRGTERTNDGPDARSMDR